MKLQDVILKAMAKKISWLDAAEIIGVCDRTMRRMREGYQEFGYDGLRDRTERKAVFSPGSDGDGGGSFAALPGGVFRSEHPALPREAAGQAPDRVELHLGATGACREPDWWRSGASAGRTGGDGRGARCQACCCTSTAASTSG